MLIIVIRFAPNKNNNQKVVKNKRFYKAPTAMSRFLLSVWKFQQFAQVKSTLILQSFMRANWGLS